MLPNSEKVVKGFAIHPGDTITASLANTGTVNSRRNKTQQQVWTLSMTDLTTNKTWSTTVEYNSSLSSAEWIMEAPYNHGILPLADYGTATFDPGTADGVNPGLNTEQGVIMYDPQGQTSNVSAPDSDTDGFDAAWGNGTTLTTVSPPSS